MSEKTNEEIIQGAESAKSALAAAKEAAKQEDLANISSYFRDKIDLAWTIAEKYPLKRQQKIFDSMVDHFLLVERVMLQARVAGAQLAEMQQATQPMIVRPPGPMKPS